jgi:DNA polymerase V
VGITTAPQELLYKAFGINAELLIDHACGREDCQISDIKQYKSKTKSVSFSQILPRDYSLAEARVVISEMILNGCQELMRRHVITSNIWIGVGYSGDSHPSTHGTIRIRLATSLSSKIMPSALQLFEQVALTGYKIRRLGISFADVCDESCEGYDLFTDWAEVEREKARELAVLEITDRYGKNAVLRGMNYLGGATQRERNGMIGGHRAGYDDAKG